MRPPSATEVLCCGGLAVAQITNLTQKFTISQNTSISPPGTISPLAQPCSSNLSRVTCINQYASVMPYLFFRPVSTGGPIEPSFGSFDSVFVPNDPSFDLVNGSDFLVFDRQRGLDLLGPNPSYTFEFKVSTAIHEAPIYVAAQNKLYFAQLQISNAFLPQLVIDLNQKPPTISNYTSDPPVYASSGGTFHNGLLYWGASAGVNNVTGTTQRAGIITTDPNTNKSTALLNNYYGFYFNMVDDLFVHPGTGDVWFTDPQYAWFVNLSTTAPQLPAAVYRFRPSTGSVSLVEDTLSQPNGIAISPDQSTIYISDTGALSGTIDPSLGPIGDAFNATGKRTIYAYDVDGNGTYISNKRAFYLAQDWIPDGLKVARNGYVVTAAGRGVDVLDQEGVLLVRVQTNYTVQNFAWTGEGLTTLWLTGQGGVSRVEWGLAGQVLV